MLSVAKHLLFLVENKQKQIPRFARDDNRRGLFISLLVAGTHVIRGVSIRLLGLREPAFQIGVVRNGPGAM
jgi:hypothetical protein